MNHARTFVRSFAHRGTTLLAPENTSAAFDVAIGVRADVLETDVRLSRDGVVIVTHDRTVDRTTDGSGAVRDHTHAALARLDAGYRFTDSRGGSPWRGRGLTLLTLDELLDRYPHVGINIDLKDPDPAAARAVAGILSRRTRPGFCNVGSFHAEVIRDFRRLAPDITTAAHPAEVAALLASSWLPPFRPRVAYRYAQIPVRRHGLSLDRPRLIRRARELGADTIYWTINEPAEMRRLLERGAAGIVSDRPDLLQPVIEAFRAGHEPAHGDDSEGSDTSDATRTGDG